MTYTPSPKSPIRINTIWVSSSNTVVSWRILMVCPCWERPWIMSSTSCFAGKQKVEKIHGINFSWNTDYSFAQKRKKRTPMHAAYQFCQCCARKLPPKSPSWVERCLALPPCRPAADPPRMPTIGESWPGGVGWNWSWQRITDYHSALSHVCWRH